MILIVLAIVGCITVVAAIAVFLIKRAIQRMDDQNKEMQSILKKYGRDKTDDTGDPKQSGN